MKKFSLLALTILVGSLSIVIAEETAVEKGQNAVDSAVTDTKKGARKVKKKVRDATGNGSVTEDIKDTAKNIGDETEDAAKKIKRKVD